MERVGSSIDNAQPLPLKECFPTKCAKAFIWVKAWYNAKVGSEPDGGQSAAQHPSNTIEPSNDMANYNTIDFMDEMSWQEFMMELNYMPTSQWGSKDMF